jgi:hypothetical protein
MSGRRPRTAAISLLALSAAALLIGCESASSTAPAESRVSGRVVAGGGGDSSGNDAAPTSAAQQTGLTPLPPDADAVLYDGTTRYEVSDGVAYRIDGARRVKVEDLYDPNYLEENYVRRSDGMYRLGNGTSYLVSRDFAEDFEGVGHVRELIGPEREWTFMTLLSKSAPSIRDYNALARNVIDGGEFRDNRLSLTQGGPGRGQVLRASATAPTGGVSVSKASLDTGLLYFEPGDTVIIETDLKVEGAMPVTVFDLESSYISKGPGLRLVLSPEGRPRIELKWGNKPSLGSTSGTLLSKDVWHKVRMRCDLDVIEGRCILEIDGQVVIDGFMQTFPVRGEAYDRLEIGVTAHDGRSGPGASVVMIDDLRVLRR